MLTALALWIFVLCAAWGYGSLVSGRRLGLLGSAPYIEAAASDTYLGLLSISAVLLVLSFAVPLTWWIGLLILTPGIAVSVRHALRAGPFAIARWRFVAAVLLLVLIAAFCAGQEVTLYDTALYHQQAANWLSSFGLVRGLALLYFRFGFLSSWFAFAAPVNSGVLAGRDPVLVGGLVFALLVVTLVGLVAQLFSTRRVEVRSLTWALLCAGILAVAVVWNLEASLSPDFVVWLLPVLVATTLTDETVSPETRAGKALLLSALGCLIKLTSLPLVAYTSIVFIRYLFRKVSRRKAFGWLASAFIAGLLLLSANLRLSGCPAFPSPILCTDRAWSVTRSMPAYIRHEMIAFFHANPHVRPEFTAMLLAAAALSAVAVRKQRRHQFVQHSVALSWTGIAFVAWQLPEARYAMGYLLLPVAVGMAAPVAAFLERRACWLEQKAPGFRSAAVVVAVWFAATVIAALHAQRGGDLVYPRRMASATGDAIHIVNRRVDQRATLSLKADASGDLSVWQPVASDQCWNAALPCTPKVTPGGVSLRDEHESYGGGFVRASQQTSSLP
jgi:hypothetical protein